MEDRLKDIKESLEALKAHAGKFIDQAKKTVSACNAINNSWSGSDLVTHANLFYGNFESPPYNRRFSIEWGLINGLPEGWGEKSSDEVRQKIEDVSGALVSNLDDEADYVESKFNELRKEAVVIFSGLSKELADEVEKFNLETKVDIFNKYWSRQITTRDSEALFAGRQIPVHKYYDATATFLKGVSQQLDDFSYVIDKAAAQTAGYGEEKQDAKDGRNVYVDKSTLLRLTKIQSVDFDLSRLVQFCSELDDNYSLENYHSCAMLLRAILDHVPPVFGQQNFDGVCAQYGGKSFKDIMKPLNETAKKIGDEYLHTQISKKILAVTKTQVSFQANLDMLLNEVAAVLEKK